MTDNRNLKRAVRARMAQTGESYTRALRAVMEERAFHEIMKEKEQGSGAGNTGEDPKTAV